jgi:3-oxoacyl-[acyl-carrier protein] reductase
MDLGIKGKCALVCGASRGIGRAVAEALAKEGARVAICARNRDALEDVARSLERATQAEIFAISADLTRPEAPTRLFDDAVARLGRLDILINNCGGPPVAALESLTPDLWTSALQGGLLSPVELIRLSVLEMKVRRWGRIVNIGSTTVHQPTEDLLLSSSVRPALAAFSKAISHKLAPYNVLVHTVCPGPTRTARMVDLARSIAEKNGVSTEQAERILTSSVSLGRMAEPEEIANVVACLVSDRLSFCTGLTLPVDGGQVKSLC